MSGKAKYVQRPAEYGTAAFWTTLFTDTVKSVPVISVCTAKEIVYPPPASQLGDILVVFTTIVHPLPPALIIWNCNQFTHPLSSITETMIWVWSSTVAPVNGIPFIE